MYIKFFITIILLSIKDIYLNGQTVNNTCGITTNTAPVSTKECTSDLRSSATCCYVNFVRKDNVTFTYCALIPYQATIEAIDNFASLGVNGTSIICGGSYLSYSILIIVLCFLFL